MDGWLNTMDLCMNEKLTWIDVWMIDHHGLMDEWLITDGLMYEQLVSVDCWLPLDGWMVDCNEFMDGLSIIMD